MKQRKIREAKRRKAEKWRSKEGKKQKSREAKKQGKAEKQRSRETEILNKINDTEKQSIKTDKNSSPPILKCVWQLPMVYCGVNICVIVALSKGIFVASAVLYKMRSKLRWYGRLKSNTYLTRRMRHDPTHRSLNLP